jgi:serine/threonine protein kinase
MSLSPGYSAPEVQLASMGDGNDWAIKHPLPSDIWSLGTILYEMMTGKPMFKGDSVRIRTAIIKEQLEPKLPGNDERYHLLTEFIRLMQRHDPARRPTIKELLLALEAKFLPPRICM